MRGHGGCCNWPNYAYIRHQYQWREESDIDSEGSQQGLTFNAVAFMSGSKDYSGRVKIRAEHVI